jgi:hypothetical protein
LKACHVNLSKKGYSLECPLSAISDRQPISLSAKKDRQCGGSSKIRLGVLIRLQLQKASASCASRADPTRSKQFVDATLL